VVVAVSVAAGELAMEERREVLTASSALDGHFKSFDGFRVLRFVDMTQGEVEMMETELFIDIWDGEPDTEHADRLAVTAALSESQLALMMMSDEFEYTVVVENLGDQVLAERKRLLSRRPMTNIRDEFFEDFRTYNEIHAYYREMNAAYPALSSITVIGRSNEGRDILGVRLTNGTITTAKPKLFIQCLIHARAHLSGPTCAWQLKMLLEGFGNNADSTFVLNRYVVMIIPIVNPDGYEFTWSDDRMWRKNRVQFQGTTCRGVDLNRNWPSHWTASANQCSDTYPGQTRASELETRAIGTWIEQQGNVQFNIDFHCYGELILRPWGNTVTATPDEAVLKALGDGMRDAIRTVHNNAYVSQRSAQLYPANGETTDYYYDTIPVGTGQKSSAHGFTFELRGNSFIVDPNQIIPQGEEIWAGIVYAAEFVADNPPSQS